MASEDFRDILVGFRSCQRSFRWFQNPPLVCKALQAFLWGIREFGTGIEDCRVLKNPFEALQGDVTKLYTFRRVPNRLRVFRGFQRLVRGVLRGFRRAVSASGRFRRFQRFQRLTGEHQQRSREQF